MYYYVSYRKEQSVPSMQGGNSKREGYALCIVHVYVLHFTERQLAARNKVKQYALLLTRVQLLLTL